MEVCGGDGRSEPDPVLSAARRLLDRLRARGVVLRAEAGRLVVEPASLLEPADRAALALRREALLDLLWTEQPDSPTVIGGAWFHY